MKSHLEGFDFKLKILSPVFIGSGKELNKKEYAFIPQSKRAVIPDLEKFTAFLDKKGILQDYINFMLGPEGDLYAWLKSVKVQEGDFAEFASYELSGGDALDEEHSKIELRQFIKDNFGRPYIPGSSLKGAIRTAILCKKLKENKTENRKRFEGMLGELAGIDKWRRNMFRRDSEEIERALLETLRLKEKNNPVNSVMRGIQVSDSEPLETSSLVLCRKIDVKQNGVAKRFNTCRECLKPGTEVSFKVTLDRNILKESGIDREFIREAIHECAKVQREQYGKFTCSNSFENQRTASGCEIYLSGGAGFWSKTIVYAMDAELGLKLTARMMTKQFPRNHKHHEDEARGVSPHALKCTGYNGRMYQMGRCEAIF